MTEDGESPKDYTYNFTIEDVHLLYTCVAKRLETWSGGHPTEQEHLIHLKNELYKGVLDFKFNHL